MYKPTVSAVSKVKEMYNEERGRFDVRVVNEDGDIKVIEIWLSEDYDSDGKYLYRNFKFGSSGIEKGFLIAYLQPGITDKEIGAALFLAANVE